jgi:hypothetical protein
LQAHPHPSLSRQRERETIAFHRLPVIMILGKPIIADLRHIRCALLNFKPIKNGALLREPLIIINLSLPRRRESSDVKGFWIPVSTGMTFLEVALILK